MAKTDIYIAVDIEADGPIPGPNSMLSLGAAAFESPVAPYDPEVYRKPISTFEINFAPLEGASQDPNTMKWWNEQDPLVLKHVFENQEQPEIAISKFVSWVRSLKGDPVMVTYPSWDYMWVHWYLIRFSGKTPFGLGCLDMKSYAFAAFHSAHFKGVSKPKMEDWVFEGCPLHTHKALDDALGQGIMFMNLLVHRQKLKNTP